MTRVHYGHEVAHRRYGVRQGLGETIPVGTPVRVAWGRWAGRLGTLHGALVKDAGGHGKTRDYAAIDLAPQGRAQARRVVVTGFYLLAEYNAERAAHGLPPEEIPA